MYHLSESLFHFINFRYWVFDYRKLVKYHRLMIHPEHLVLLFSDYLLLDHTGVLLLNLEVSIKPFHDFVQAPGSKTASAPRSQICFNSMKATVFLSHKTTSEPLCSISGSQAVCYFWIYKFLAMMYSRSLAQVG